MFEWALWVGSAFPEAVECVIGGPPCSLRPDQVLHGLKDHEALGTFPESVVKLLDWFLKNDENRRRITNQIEAIILRLPKRASLKSSLLGICERLESLAYPDARALKQRVETEFVC